jgi:hypothetical protein
MIAAKNNAKSAYEGILVIGQNAESQEVKQVVEREIIEVERDTPTTIIPVFQPPSNPQAPQGPPIILQQQQQQQPTSPQALAAQRSPSPAPVAPSDTPADGTPCTGVDNVDIGVYKNGKCTPETLPPEPSQTPATAAAAPRGIIPSCILTADCPPSLLPPSPPPSTSSITEPDNGNEPDPCLLDPSSPECQVADTFDPLAGEAGQTGEGGEDGTENTDEIARESEDTDGEDSESDSESDGGSDGDGGDGGSQGGSEGGGEED